MGIRLDVPLTKAVGDRTAKVLRTALGLETVNDLLRHYPRKYVKRGQLTELSELVPGAEATIVAQVTKVSRRAMAARRGQMMTVEVRDSSDAAVEITFFNPRAANQLKPGMLGMFAGKIGEYHGRIQMTNPEFAKLDADGDEAGDTDVDNWAGELIPLYPASGGLPSWKIARCVRMVLDQLDADPEDDPLPRPVRARRGLLSLPEALRRIHRPDDWPEIAVARKRLKWDEALPMQVVLAQRREAMKALPATPRQRVPGGLLDAFDAALPFQLTAGQRQVGEEIERDLASVHPMHRLLQGDVGSGKTMVALRAMLVVADAGGQSVLLAPTEVLAQQHHRSIIQMLGAAADVPVDLFSEVPAAEPGRKQVKVALLTGSQNAKERRENLLDAASGAAGIVVGTHAVIQEHVQFADLGLVVIDEQHRFGVEQRDALRAKGQDPPHVLVMTATPIPRTVAMTVFGDLETSILSELPAGRSPIATHVVAAHEHPSHFTRVWERIREEVAAGHQAYVVCPRIGEAGEGAAEPADDGSELVSEPGQQRPPLAVVEVAARLAEGPLKGLRVGLLHGRLAPDEKDAVMRAYAAHELDVLVATTVIEVGVNVPNSTVIVVMDADRFGVSQLHQLRGRVGRGRWPGLCLLVTESPEGSPARERLAAVASTLDGFELSKIDLALRKEGDVLGASQSGYRSSLRMLSVIEDEDVIRAARDEATPLVAADPELAGQPGLAAAVAALLETQRAEYLGKT